MDSANLANKLQIPNRYHNISHKKYDYTTDDPDKGQDKGKAFETVNDKESEEFAKNILETMQDLSKEIKEMRVDIMRESLGRFHQGESSDMSHYGTSQPVSLPQAPQASQCSNMPTFLAVENEGLQEKTSLEGYFVEYDSQSHRFKDNLSFQEFFHLKDQRRPWK